MVRRAKEALRKGQKPPRAKMFLREATVAALLGNAVSQGNVAVGMLYLAAYVFLLRVPSELLPAVVGADGDALSPLAAGVHSCLAVCGNELVLRLAKRKNKLHGTVLRRGCWCDTRRQMCPVHVLGAWVQRCTPGVMPFAAHSADWARKDLRCRLLELGVEGASGYWLHDFRRGHAQDMVDAGGRLGEILRAGEWSSPAFTKYLDLEGLETSAVVEAHVIESDDDDDV
jgi:hypothetical protein